MRNTITIFDSDKINPMFRDLEPGDLFRYPENTNAQNVYIKTNVNGQFYGVLLATGSGYGIQGDKIVEPISNVRIQR